ncbi:hypothetical protein C3B61_09810 [Cryobacterium zongtaii]|uniref:Uncharacterized protein n=1 Tax=Cryobacterium zongtaii TaxID=1259217 RepID=A0A2S3ZFF9_9MICO|nr:hypothetical protein [Cryobacterium zongtaii]POH65845.1 hypothetical protein C3B61_09810 [Cryobacterium zongtaii]
MDIQWDESFFQRTQVEQPIYWVCFWTEISDATAMHDPMRIVNASSVDEVLNWIHETLGSRRYELFVETTDHAESVQHGWVEQKQLVRLAGNYSPSGTVATVFLTRADDS